MKPVLTFAVLGDVPPKNRYCMEGVSRVLPMLRKLGVQAVLAPVIMIILRALLKKDSKNE